MLPVLTFNGEGSMTAKKRIGLQVPLVIAGLLLAASAGYGQAGSALGAVTFSTDCGIIPGVGAGVGVGITFDGTNLWYSCNNSKSTANPNDLYKADPKTGAVIAGYNVAGGLGAIAYDAGRNVIWAGEGGYTAATSGMAIKIPLDANKNVSGPFVAAFPVSQAFASPPSPQYLVDGLAIDALADTLYIHYDFATEIAKYNASTGAFLGFVPQASGIQNGTPAMQSPPIPNCVVSGLAIGGEVLFESADYCDQVWGVDKMTQISLFQFGIKPPVSSSFDEKGLTCDTSTFSPHAAIWVKDAFSPQAYAFSIPPGSCGNGGKTALLPLPF
jgi:hypothetical protein